MLFTSKIVIGSTASSFDRVHTTAWHTSILLIILCMANLPHIVLNSRTSLLRNSKNKDTPGKNICVSERLHALSCTRPRVTLNALIFASSTRYISASITH